MTERLWLCADLSHPNADELLDRVAAALLDGPATVWLRSARDPSARDLARTARALRALTLQVGAALFVGDRVDVALAVGADGAHLPERSFDPASIASIALHRSRSVHDTEGARAHGPSSHALVAAPFGAVPGKGAPLGAAGITAICRAAGGTPVIAMGGVDGPEAVRACLAAGAYGVGARAALMASRDPRAACGRLRDALSELTAGREP